MAFFRKQSSLGKNPRQPSAKRGDADRTPRERERLAHRVIIRPHITEKSGRIASQNQYVFIVTNNATKQEIKRAIFETYGIHPLRVATIRIPRKRRRLGRTEGWIAGYKKAIVTLPEGKTIEVLPK